MIRDDYEKYNSPLILFDLTFPYLSKLGYKDIYYTSITSTSHLLLNWL